MYICIRCRVATSEPPAPRCRPPYRTSAPGCTSELPTIRNLLYHRDPWAAINQSGRHWDSATRMTQRERET